METLKGLLYFEVGRGIARRCALVEDPKNKNLTHILICASKPKGEGEFRFSRKRGSTKFKAFKFRTLEKVEDINMGVEAYIIAPKDSYIQIPISELKKLGTKLEWID